jgi:hypothetical protein
LQLQTSEEFSSLKQYFLTQGDNPWNASSFSGQDAENIYQQVIDNQKNCFNFKSNGSSDLNLT